MNQEALDRAQAIAAAADKRKAQDVAILHVAGQTIVCDFFVVCSGRSLTHVESIAEGVAEALEELGARPAHRSAPRDAKWIALDCGDVVFHVLTEDARSYYNLEGLWSQAERVEFAGAETLVTEP